MSTIRKVKLCDYCHEPLPNKSSSPSITNVFEVQASGIKKFHSQCYMEWFDNFNKKQTAISTMS